ncbi:MAG: hypothetical protein IPK33_08290 [Gemmatimonadetes bacterium]|nr:hypothetical protein [Gemmatimonadota bacterium]
MPDKICFVIAPIGDPESEVRKRSDQVLKHVIRPAVSERQFRAIRADEISEPGIITSQVIQHIVDDPLVVADLTGRNPNVFYELAVRHALRKPLVQIISRGEAIPFDVAGMRTIPVDHRDLDSVEEARKEIVRQIDAAESLGKIETPISVAVELQSLRQSDDPSQRSLAELLSGIADLRASIASIEKRLSDPTAMMPLEYFEFLLRRMSEDTPSWRVLSELYSHPEMLSKLPPADRDRLLRRGDLARSRHSAEKKSEKQQDDESK